jgi:tripartite-type tricarboxylate transporter receptor subunit TctC
MTKLIAIVFAALASLASASAQTYPSRPITLIVPFPPGGLTDVVGRILAEGMRVSLGQSVIIENVGGATGSIGTGRVARAAPDGYTLVLGIWNTHVANGAVYSLQYDIVNDFQPIAFLADAPLLFNVKKGFPANNMKEFVAWLKANSDKATMGSTGAGSPGNLLGVLMRIDTGTQFQLVSYRGVALVMQDLVAGQIDMAFSNPATAMPHVRAGAIKAFAVTAKNRLAIAPDIPTMEEAGVPSLHFSLWAGLFAPKGTPKEIVAKLNDAAANAMAEPGLRQKLVSQGFEVAPRSRQTPEALAAQQKADIRKWWPIIKEAGIKVQ